MVLILLEEVTIGRKSCARHRLELWRRIFNSKEKGKLNGWIGYTLSWTNRQFTQINEGKIYPYKYDRRHDISIVAIYKLSNKLDVSSTWVYGTGNAISLPLQSYAAVVDPGSYLNNEVQYYGGKNNYRMAPYSRMDVSVNKHKKRNGEE